MVAIITQKSKYGSNFLGFSQGHCEVMRVRERARYHRRTGGFKPLELPNLAYREEVARKAGQVDIPYARG